MNAENKPSAFISERFANPDLVAVKKENWTWAAILAILALLIVLATLGIQYVDFEGLSKAL